MYINISPKTYDDIIKLAAAINTFKNEIKECIPSKDILTQFHSSTDRQQAKCEAYILPEKYFHIQIFEQTVFVQRVRKEYQVVTTGFEPYNLNLLLPNEKFVFHTYESIKEAKHGFNFCVQQLLKLSEENKE